MPVIGAVVGGLASGAAGVGISSLLGGDGEGDVSQQQMMPDWQSAIGKQLAGWIEQYLPNFKPGEAYTGKLTAGATPYETQGLDMLGDYMNAPNTGDLFGAGKQQIMDTLGGKYADPNESPYIKSMINLSKMNLNDLITQARAQRGGRGTYYTTDALRQESQLGERTQNYMNTLIGQFIQNERQNMLNAVPQATAMDEYATTTAPLRKVSASQTLGSLNRLIEQSDLEKQYQEFVRQRQEMAMPVSTAQNLYGTNTNYGVMDYQNQDQNPLMNLLSPLISGVGTGASGLWNKFFGGGSTGTSNIANNSWATSVLPTLGG